MTTKPNDPNAPQRLWQDENIPELMRGPKSCTQDKINNVNNCGTGILNYSKSSQYCVKCKLGVVYLFYASIFR